MNGNPSFVNLIRSNTIRIYARKYDTNYIEREYIGDGGPAVGFFSPLKGLGARW